MTKQQVRVIYVLCFVIAASVTTQMLSVVEGVSLRGQFLSLLPTDAVRTKEEQNLQRRLNGLIIKKCDALAATDENVDCPDINDFSEVKKFLSRTAPEAPAAKRASRLQLGRLDPEKRALLQKYRDEGRCPQTIRRVMPGFYELCLSLIVDVAQRDVPQFLHGAAPASRAEQRRLERMQERGILGE
jgi:hypothetical protein